MNFYVLYFGQYIGAITIISFDAFMTTILNDICLVLETIFRNRSLCDDFLWIFQNSLLPPLLVQGTKVIFYFNIYIIELVNLFGISILNCLAPPNNNLPI